MKKTRLNPKTVHSAPSDYSQECLVKGKKMLFISRQVPIDVKGNLVGPGDLRAQFKQVLDNMKIVLAAGGADLSKIVQTMTFLRDSEDIVKKFWEVRKSCSSSIFREVFTP